MYRPSHPPPPPRSSIFVKLLLEHRNKGKDEDLGKIIALENHLQKYFINLPTFYPSF